MHCTFALHVSLSLFIDSINDVYLVSSCTHSSELAYILDVEPRSCQVYFKHQLLGLDSLLNFAAIVQIRKAHDAYTKKKMTRKVKIKHGSEMAENSEINCNTATSLVAELQESGNSNTETRRIVRWQGRKKAARIYMPSHVQGKYEVFKAQMNFFNILIKYSISK